MCCEFLAWPFRSFTFVIVMMSSRRSDSTWEQRFVTISILSLWPPTSFLGRDPPVGLGSLPPPGTEAQGFGGLCPRPVVCPREVPIKNNAVRDGQCGSWSRYGSSTSPSSGARVSRNVFLPGWRVVPLCSSSLPLAGVALLPLCPSLPFSPCLSAPLLMVLATLRERVYLPWVSLALPRLSCPPGSPLLHSSTGLFYVRPAVTGYFVLACCSATKARVSSLVAGRDLRRRWKWWEGTERKLQSEPVAIQLKWWEETERRLQSAPAVIQLGRRLAVWDPIWSW